ncbi:ComEC/Rec2 family competence protein [Gordonia sp. PKS22-38]|uniref:ComEC/Rec2 family competence protein n=1 Tax=Gordonia prachuapensis TaxID=3115651 RepID=A0ABU7MWI2_9ACTN|nr:ComEC/Rec2 family competence protein [Gordonia sp. PKS22-38]
MSILPPGDYRLTVPAAVTWTVSLLILLGPPLPAWALPVVGGVTVAAGAIAVRCGWVAWAAVSLVVVAGGMVAVTAAALAVRDEVRSSHPLSSVDGKARISGVIRDDAVALGPASASRVAVRVDVDVVSGRDAVSGAAELTGPMSHWAELVPGQRFSVVARVSPPRRGELLVARLSAVSQPDLHGRPPPHQRIATVVRERLQYLSARGLGPDAAGLLPGLVIGDTSGLGSEVREDFRAAGLTHLVAVSGSNFAIVIGAAVMAVRMLGATPRVTVVVGMVMVVCFVILVRPSPSVLRAAMMGMIALLALWGSRRAQALPALGAATVVGLLWWPELATEPGFALSVIATGGLVLWSAAMRDRLRGWRVPPGIAELVAMALTAQLVTAPVVALLSGRFTIVGVLANVAVAPVVGLIGIVGTAAAIVGALGPPDGIGAMCAELMIRALAPELWWMLGCARVLGGQSWSTVPVPSGVAGAAMVAAVTMFFLLAITVFTRAIGDACGGGGSVAGFWHHGRRD